MIEIPDDPEDAGFPLGMSAAEAKEYLFHHITTLKLTEKDRDEAAAGYRKWTGRAELARSRSAGDLAAEAEKEAERLAQRRDSLDAELARLGERIAFLRRQLPGVAARERSVDPDLLEEELRILLGEGPYGAPGETSPSAKAERGFEALKADAALEMLKAKMGLAPKPAPEGILNLTPDLTDSTDEDDNIV
jgi:hypothetical protein